MSRSDRERREAEKAARRARRLADRAEQRAQRKDEHAQRAADRAEKLAERANRRRSPKDRERDLEGSIEDFVDEVAEKWSRKAEEWIDEKSQQVFEDHRDRSEQRYSDGLNSADVEARNAREAADKARRAAEAAASYVSDNYPPQRDDKRKSNRGKSRRRRQTYRGNSYQDYQSTHRARRRRRYGSLYRDRRHKKICGVCAGTAEYFGVETWQVRLAALCGLVFVPQVAIPTYFITYFLMDNKPYYREATDRFDEQHEPEQAVKPMRQKKRRTKDSEPQIPNVQAFRVAKQKFANIEDRLRLMESHVTSSQFELQREIKKISGDD